MRPAAGQKRVFVLREEAPGRYAVRGELTFTTAPAALKETLPLFRTRNGVAIDLRGVERADSAGIALLIEWVRLARKRGVSLRLENMPAQVENLVRVSGTGVLLASCSGAASQTTDTELHG
ncbi:MULTISPECIES: STAS domain-containing protein [Methylococcus]|jgi:phospholipid transport system transporter-binding protein|uniref:Phospholipid transport system transporter-binding protein n=1 Tax=Methylococcus capsulatus TaxID=414 RepID=A0AA35UCZ2_METCP|nr:STAS domain-containing protein [Methylococcus capsulatus]CAI8859262.1 phospholipid transport system transporter-binding protein [Methylococcus capsulatus]